MNPILDLANDFKRWEDVYENGYFDPIYPDGENLNLIRTQIISTKSRIQSLYKDLELPSLFYKDTPPLIESNYMAHAHEIREEAAHVLKIYENNINYRILLELDKVLSKKQKGITCITNVLGYVSNLRGSFIIDDVILMRRHVNYPTRYISSFSSCLNNVIAQLKKECNKK